MLSTAGWLRGFLLCGLFATSVSATFAAAPDPKRESDEKKNSDAAAQSLAPLHLATSRDSRRLRQHRRQEDAGGPGSSTVWLHMGAFGPKRVLTTNDSHSPAAPYQVVDNEYSLLDVSDLVFIEKNRNGGG